MGSRAPSILILFGLVGAYSMGARCGGPPQVRIDSPADLALFTADGVAVSAIAGSRVQTSSITLEVDGVDLVAALGLVPPFSGQAGSVLIAGGLLDVTNFSIEQGSPASLNRIDVDLSGFVLGPHSLVVSALDADSVLKSDRADFDLVDFFTQEASALTSAGASPISFGLSTLANASLGEAVAAQPIGTAAGETVRSGFVERAEQLIAGGP